jgi:hypothetical protein
MICLTPGSNNGFTSDNNLRSAVVPSTKDISHFPSLFLRQFEFVLPKWRNAFGDQTHQLLQEMGSMNRF